MDVSQNDERIKEMEREIGDIKMECLGFTDNGIQREERYSKNSRDAQKRFKKIVNHPDYDIMLKAVGFKETIKGVMQCTEVIIKGKQVTTLDKDGRIVDVSYHNTKNIRKEMNNGKK